MEGVDGDDLRALHDLLSSGPLRSGFPLQTRVCASRLFPSEDADSDLLLLAQQSLAQSRPRAPSSSQPQSSQLNQMLPQAVVAAAERFILKDCPSALCEEESFTISDALALADDVDMLSRFFGRNVPSRATSTQPIVIDSSAAHEPTHARAPEKLTSSYRAKDMRDEGDGKEGSEPPLKKNHFTTAKDRYLEEGYKLPPKTGGDSSSTQSKSASGKTAGDDAGLIERIEADIIVKGSEVSFGDIAGLEFAKKCVQELICWPMTRPDLFRGLRAVPKGILLFGPPGTGKTLIGKAIAHEIKATFFNISASSLTSKWVGEGEKAVRLLFAVAIAKQPSVVFIDEVDSLLSMRTSDENDSTRRIKTEFLVQLDGAGTDASARVICIGATNRPDELDEVRVAFITFLLLYAFKGARRRFVKRLYIPLPDEAGREQLIRRLLDGTDHSLSTQDVSRLILATKGFSGADIRALCTEAAMGPVRSIIQQGAMISSIQEHDVPPISFRDFSAALDSVTSSISEADLVRYIEWNAVFGSYRRME